MSVNAAQTSSQLLDEVPLVVGVADAETLGTERRIPLGVHLLRDLIEGDAGAGASQDLVREPGQTGERT